MTFANAVYEYDDNGNATQLVLDGMVMFTYHYNAQDRLIKVDDVNGGAIAEYAYDPFGRRLWKEVAGVRTYFFYSDEGLMAEYGPGGTELRSYGYQPDSTWTTDPLFLRSGGQYFFYQNDHLGTPQKLIAVNGAVVWSAQYSAFGEARIEIETVTNNLRFPGQYYDTETGLHYNWHRYYDPKIGRYMRSDPIGFDGGDVNWYGYVGNNVVNVSDFLGLIPYPKHVETKLRESFAPLVKDYFGKMVFADQYLWQCMQLYEAAAMKFLADEYEERGIGDWFQDVLLAKGIFPEPRTDLEKLYDKIDPNWKWGPRYLQVYMRFHYAYNDVGPSNIAIKTYLEAYGIDPRTLSREEYIDVVNLLLTDETQVEFTLKLVIQAVEELKGHFDDTCCRYDRRSVELIVNYLRSGKERYWKNVRNSPIPETYRYLMTDEQFEQWKLSPDSIQSALIQKYVARLEPGEIDHDRYTIIEELITQYNEIQ